MTLDDMTVAMTMLQSYIPDGFNYYSNLVIPADIFYQDLEYHFTLITRNFLNLSSEPKSITLKVMDSPSLIQLDLRGSPFREVNPLDDIIITVHYEVSNCSSVQSTELSFLWKALNITNGQQTDVTSILDIITLATPSLWIPPGTLSAGDTYLLTMTASLFSEEATVDVTLYAEHPEIELLLVGGDYQLLPSDQEIVLDISESVNIQFYENQIQITWTCINQTCCQPCVGVSLPSAPVVTLPPGTLGVGQYMFTVQIYNRFTNRTISIETVVEIVMATAAQVGGVRILSVGRGESFVLSTDEVVISAVVLTPKVGVVKWEGLFVPGSAHLPLTPLVARSPLHYAVLSNEEYSEAVSTEDQRYLVTDQSVWQVLSLVLQRNVLLPGEEYQFGLTYTSQVGGAVKGSTSVRVAPRPSSGSLHAHLKPLSCGTRLSLRAQHWTERPHLLPLQHQFGYVAGGVVNKDTADDNIIWSNTPAYSQWHHVTLYPSNHTRIAIYGVLRVYNTLGAYTQVIASPLEIVGGRECSISDLIDGYHSNPGSDYENVLVNLAGVIPFISEWLPLEVDLSQFQLKVVNLLLSIFEDTLPKMKPYLDWLLWQLKEASSWDVLDVATKEKLFIVSHDIINIYTRFYKHSVYSKPGMSVQEATLVVEIINNVLFKGAESTSRILATALSDMYFDLILPSLGHTLCIQQGIGEENPVITSTGGNLIVKSTWTHFPRIYLTSDGPTPPPVFVHWSPWQPNSSPTDGCPTSVSQCLLGQCLLSVQYKKDLHWDDHDPTSIIKTTPTSLLLLDRLDGTVLQLGDIQGGVALEFPLTLKGSPPGTLTCVYWDKSDLKWSTDGCTTVAGVS